MSLGGIAAIIAAVAFVLLVGALAVPLIKLGRTVDAATKAITDITEQAVPILASAHVTVEGVNQTLGGVNHQLDKVDTLTDHVGAVTGSIAQVTTLFGATVSGPLVKAAAFSYGVRSALRARKATEVEREIRDELKKRRRGA
ncbi:MULTISPECIES: DUF948 domain-containing protein [Cryptosporangium]|uniref:Uncharacterized protein containing a divergent version of the methyl-accepting chemotaxis-like domain n=2 Tax=Cryptosporangium TaxID=65502 RepID=A0A011AH40_9ACTN|nr:DUF948 domain-containing protein [Cryptosporangium arvum]EXG81316.1 uncharacterized protein containing a divergent version of the methyl-accepting chemotaxis-like domain [Cryptosporangium arvum DSM 44712]